MKSALKGVAVILATTFFLSSAQAQEVTTPEDFVVGLVEAALPKDETPEGLINSGSLGVTLFLLCQLAENSGEEEVPEVCLN